MLYEIGSWISAPRWVKICLFPILSTMAYITGKRATAQPVITVMGSVSKTQQQNAMYNNLSMHIAQSYICIYLQMCSAVICKT